MVKTVADYVVKWGFGITSPSPWSATHPHMGVDRPTPMRTPLVINGQTVGYSGNTGGVAPHHHLQKVQNGKVVDPKNGGFIIPTPATVYQVDNVNDSNIGKALRIRDGQGVEWSHFHLDEITVKVGERIGDNMPTIITDQHIGLLRIAHSEIGGWNLHEVHAGLHDATFLGAWKGRTVDELIWAQWNEKNAEAYRNQREANKAKIVELQTALANEQAKPAKEIIKEVVTIVEKPVEVIKIQEVPAQVDEKQVVTNWFKRIWESLFKKG